MGAMLLTAGAKGKRYALPHARIMIHQPLAGMEGTATEILIHAKEFIRIEEEAERDPAQAHRPDAGRDREGHRPRQLHVRRGGQGVRADRQGAGADAGRRAAATAVGRLSSGWQARTRAGQLRTSRRRGRDATPRPGRSVLRPLAACCRRVVAARGCKPNKRYDLIEAELRTRERELPRPAPSSTRPRTSNRALRPAAARQRRRPPPPAGRRPTCR